MFYAYAVSNVEAKLQANIIGVTGTGITPQCLRGYVSDC